MGQNGQAFDAVPEVDESQMHESKTRWFWRSDPLPPHDNDILFFWSF